jgi:enhancer of polycomb-like protein
MRSLIGRGPADELRSLEAVQENRDREIYKEIQLNIEKHINWNKGYVDKTRAPLTPESEKTLVDRSKDYRKAMPVQIPLPTPPASVSDEDMETGELIDGENRPRIAKFPIEPSIRYSSPDPSAPPVPSFRTRIGRGGRVVVDRRLPFRYRNQSTHKPARANFDSEEEDIEDVASDDDQESKFDRCMTQRSFLFGKAQNPNPTRQIEGVPHPNGIHRSPPQVNGVQHPNVAPAGA